MFNYIVVHYDEIGIKGQNRPFFENKLVEDLNTKINKFSLKIFKRYGKVICNLKEDLSKKDISSIVSILELTPGISSFSFAQNCNLDLEDISSKSINLLKKKEFISFKVNTKRSNKNFKLNSLEINKKIGSDIVENLNKKVDLENPNIILNIEIGEKEVFIYDNKHFGIGGLALKSSGNVICSLSGGLDSPVASYMMMKRGCNVVYVHIQNDNLANKELQQKIEDLCKQLSKIQNKVKLYIVPFSKIQKQIIMFVPSEYRMIIYRRFMNKIINKIADSENSKLIVTGDSIGQVASQTIENINCIYDSSKYPIVSPLIAYNKNEIIVISKKIGTYNISIKPYPDCCSFMIATHPKTNAKLIDILKIEENIKDKEKLIEDSINKKQVLEFKYNFCK
jgi:tRNA uracil 4-sulfurtransferase